MGGGAAAGTGPAGAASMRHFVDQQRLQPIRSIGEISTPQAVVGTEPDVAIRRHHDVARLEGKPFRACMQTRSGSSASPNVSATKPRSPGVSRRPRSRRSQLNRADPRPHRRIWLRLRRWFRRKPKRIGTAVPGFTTGSRPISMTVVRARLERDRSTGRHVDMIKRRHRRHPVHALHAGVHLRLGQQARFRGVSPSCCCDRPGW